MQQFVWTYYTSFCTFSKSTVGLCKKGLCPKYCLHKDKTFMNVSDVQCVTFRPWVFCVQWIEWWASSPTPIYVSCQLHARDLTLPPGGSPTLNPLTAGLSKPMLYIYNARLWHNLAHKQISYIYLLLWHWSQARCEMCWLSVWLKCSKAPPGLKCWKGRPPGWSG